MDSSCPYCGSQGQPLSGSCLNCAERSAELESCRLGPGTESAKRLHLAVDPCLFEKNLSRIAAGSKSPEVKNGQASLAKQPAFLYSQEELEKAVPGIKAGDRSPSRKTSSGIAGQDDAFVNTATGAGIDGAELSNSAATEKGSHLEEPETASLKQEDEQI